MKYINPEEYRRKIEMIKNHEVAEGKPKTIGFWRHGQNKLVSTGIPKSAIPKYARLVLCRNKFKKKGDNLPDYVGYFVNVKDLPVGAEPMTILQVLKHNEDETN